MDDDACTFRRKRKGGLRQRLAASEAAEKKRKVTVKSELVEHLVEQWSLGLISPQEVQKQSEKSCKDFRNAGCQAPEDLAKMASLGGSGNSPQNMSRDLFHFAEPRTIIAKSFMCHLPFKDGKRHAQALLLPHEHFSNLYHNFPRVWSKSILPDDSDISSFWKDAKSHPSMKQHPLLRDPDRNWMQKCVPLGLHGDGVPTSGVGKIWCKMMTSWSWCSLVGGGTGAEHQHYIYSVPDNMTTQETFNQFGQIMRWSCTALYKGNWPASDHEGNPWPKGSVNWKKANEPLADGYRGILFAVQGDLEYLSYSLQLPRWSRLDRPCTICKATGGSHEHTWLDFRPDAAWTKLLWDPVEWSNSESASRSPLFKTPGLSCQSVSYDYLHCKQPNSISCLFHFLALLRSILCGLAMLQCASLYTRYSS
jgi:hypothetical protein